MSRNKMKLFMLRYRSNRKIVKGEDGIPLYFSDKLSAKQAREDGQQISYGPQHYKYSGES